MEGKLRYGCRGQVRGMDGLDAPDREGINPQTRASDEHTQAIKNRTAPHPDSVPFAPLQFQ